MVNEEFVLVVVVSSALSLLYSRVEIDGDKDIFFQELYFILRRRAEKLRICVILDGYIRIIDIKDRYVCKCLAIIRYSIRWR